MFYQDLTPGHQRLIQKSAVVLVVLLNLLALALIASYGIDAWKEYRTGRQLVQLQIPVTGEGKVSVAPDVARVTVSIVTRGEFLKNAQEENAQKSNVLVGYLKSENVLEKDIRTVGYNIFPQYSYPVPPCTPGQYCPPQAVNDRTPKIIGYEVRNAYEITIRDLAKAGDILTGVVGAGANEVSGISFTIDKPEALIADARKKAIDDANEKATRLAHDLGLRRGKLVSFSEGGYQPYFYDQYGYGKGGDGAIEAAPAPSIAPGETELRVNVTAVYEFK